MRKIFLALCFCLASLPTPTGLCQDQPRISIRLNQTESVDREGNVYVFAPEELIEGVEQKATLHFQNKLEGKISELAPLSSCGCFVAKAKQKSIEVSGEIELELVLAPKGSRMSQIVYVSGRLGDDEPRTLFSIGIDTPVRSLVALETETILCVDGKLPENFSAKVIKGSKVELLGCKFVSDDPRIECIFDLDKSKLDFTYRLDDPNELIESDRRIQLLIEYSYNGSPGKCVREYWVRRQRPIAISPSRIFATLREGKWRAKFVVDDLSKIEGVEGVPTNHDVAGRYSVRLKLDGSQSEEVVLETTVVGTSKFLCLLRMPEGSAKPEQSGEVELYRTGELVLSSPIVFR
jgi:hypothetical protein